MSEPAAAIARYLDDLLGVDGHPDYPGALNGLQVDHRGPVSRLAAAVDCSLETIKAAADLGANFLVVHHGLFWGGAERLTGAALARVRVLLERDIAVYSAHLPLDSHPQFGNNVLLAKELGLTPSGPFGSYQGISIGVAGESDVATEDLVRGASALANRHGGSVRTSRMVAGRRTSRWGICTGGGASSGTIREAEARGIDTLIVGEGPHHTAVEAPERGLVVIYAGHYATETLGVQALTEAVARANHLPWEFVSAPTGL